MSSPSFADGRAPTAGVRRIALLGSTGSIGRQAVDVIAADPTLHIVALTAGRNTSLLAEQATRLRPAVVAVADDPARAALRGLPGGTQVLVGEAALLAIAARPDVDLVVVGTGGMLSLGPVLAALSAGKVVATANKETLVAGGHLVMPLAKALAAARGGNPADPLSSPLGWVRPIDSEHSAIWQCLVGESLESVDRLILTASGGPFRNGPTDLSQVTPEMALRHPTWSMGPKITVDSATLANKGLEVIEARWLYDIDPDRIDVVIHPQSVMHSAVLFRDGSLKAQLGTPDMRLPIQYALTYPARHASRVAGPDLLAIGRLDFAAPDTGRFPALRIAREAARLGSRATAALIAADEIAVQRFLAGTLSFTGISRLLDVAVDRFGTSGDQSPDLATVVALDVEVRAAYATGAFDGAR